MQMPSMLKGLLIGAGGAIVGFIGGYFFARHRLEKAYEAELEGAISEECTRLREAHGKVPEVVERESKPPFNTEDSGISNDLSDFNDYQKMMTFSSYNAITPPEESEEEEDDPMVEEEGLAHQMNIYARDHGDDEPRLSDEEEFANIHPYYNPVSFEYYILDKTLLNEDLEPVDDPGIYVGDLLDEVPPEAAQYPGVMYILNGRLGLAIEVTLRDDAYHDGDI